MPPTKILVKVYLSEILVFVGFYTHGKKRKYTKKFHTVVVIASNYLILQKKY